MGYSLQFARLALHKVFSDSIGLTIAGMVCIFLFFSCGSSPEGDLFDVHFHPYKDIISRRGAIDHASPVLLDAMSAYNEQDYEAAISRFLQVRGSDQENPAVNFYLGISYLATNNPQSAADCFTPVLEEQDPIFGPHAAWYLALAYLKAGQREKALEQLHHINRPDSRYGVSCMQILAAFPESQLLSGETAATN